MSTFGTIKSFRRVETYFLDLADKWFLEYLAAVEREEGYPERTFPPIRDRGTANEFDKWPEEHLPFLLVMNTGLAERPRRDGNGIWHATVLMGCAIIVSAPTKSLTRDAAHVYGAAFKAMVLQHQSLENPDDIGGVAWVDERPAPVPGDAERTLNAATCQFTVDFLDVVDEGGYPPLPDPRPDPYADPGDPVIIVGHGKNIIKVEEVS